MEAMMAKCANCDKSILMGGVKDEASGLRYCSNDCRFKAFFPRFFRALTSAITSASQPAKTPDQATNSDREGWERAEFPGFADDGKDLLVVVLGLGGCAAVAGLVHSLVNLVGYPFHAQTVWFVIPVGAFLCGMVAGIGFWLALRLMNRLPRSSTFVAAGLGGAGCYVLIYFLIWWRAEFPGGKVRDHVGFLPFFQQLIEHQQVRFGRGPGPGVELGKWGYPRFGINVLGFALGVVATVAIGGGKSYCSRCKRYLTRVGKQTRSGSNPDATAAALGPVISALLAGQIQEALELHSDSPDEGKNGFWTSTIAVEACPGCGMHKAILTATVPGQRGPQAVSGFKYEGTSSGPLQVFL
jgi:hypothetical protein